MKILYVSACIIAGLSFLCGISVYFVNDGSSLPDSSEVELTDAEWLRFKIYFWTILIFCISIGFISRCNGINKATGKPQERFMDGFRFRTKSQRREDGMVFLELKPISSYGPDDTTFFRFLEEQILNKDGKILTELPELFDVKVRQKVKIKKEGFDEKAKSFSAYRLIPVTIKDN